LEKGIIGLYMPEFDLAVLDDEHYLKSDEWAGISGQWEQHVRNVVASKGKPPKLYWRSCHPSSDCAGSTTSQFRIALRVVDNEMTPVRKGSTTVKLYAMSVGVAKTTDMSARWSLEKMFANLP
jgi:hypothetical protein